VLCDTWNRSDDNDTVSGIAILDTTAIPEMRCAMFFRNRQSHRPTLLTEMWVSRLSELSVLWQGYSMLCILHEVRACVSKHKKKPSCRYPTVHHCSTWESRDVIGHVTDWYPMWSLIGVHLEQSLSPAVYEILCSNSYWGNEFDLSWSRDVIGHVTIRYTPYAISYRWPFELSD